MKRFYSISDLAAYLAQLDPAFEYDAVVRAIRWNRDLFERYEDLTEEQLLNLLVAVYAEHGVPEEEARRLVGLAS